MNFAFRIIIAIFLLQITHLSFASDKPLWVMDTKLYSDIKLQFVHENEILIAYLQHVINNDRKTNTKESKTNIVILVMSVKTGEMIKSMEFPLEMNKSISDIKLRFVYENEILITFFQNDLVEDLKTKALVALLLHRETGEVIKRVEWQVSKSLAANEIFIHSLPEGGYLWRIGDKLQALDLSLNIICSKILTSLTQNQSYSIIMPRSGYFFIIDQNINGIDRIYEIVDWRTFETVEKISVGVFRIKDIWNDRLLAIDSLRAGEHRWLLEKRIGDLSWNIFGFNLPRLHDAIFIYNGAIAVTCSMNDSGLFGPAFWFVMEDGWSGSPIFYGKNNRERMGGLLPVKQRPIIAVIGYSGSRIREFLDIDSVRKSWIDVWDIKSQQRLLRTKNEKDVIGSALSPYGLNIVRLSKQKLEMYAIPETPAKKK